MTGAESMELKEKFKDLRRTFDTEDISWVILRKKRDNKKRGEVAPYVKRDAIQSRLDSTFGAENWRNEYILWQKEKEGLDDKGEPKIFHNGNR